MGRPQERVAATDALMAAQRLQKAALAAAMATVAVNSISQPQIDAVLAAGVAYDAAILAAVLSFRTAEGP